MDVCIVLVLFWKVTNRYSGITTDVDSYDELPRKLGRKKSLSSSNAKIINKQMRKPVFIGDLLVRVGICR